MELSSRYHIGLCLTRSGAKPIVPPLADQRGRISDADVSDDEVMCGARWIQAGRPSDGLFDRCDLMNTNAGNPR